MVYFALRLLTNNYCTIDLLIPLFFSKQLLQDDRMGRSYNSARSGSQSNVPAPIATTGNQLDEFGIKTESISNVHSSVSGCSPSIPNTPNLMITRSFSQHPNEGNKLTLFFLQMVDILKHGSYVLTLIVMMTWSITYHSWLSFILLLASCIIWMTPNSR